MITKTEPTSAKIYEFPKRGRFAPERQSLENALGLRGSMLAPKVASGGSWYHEEAIREERTRKN